MTEPLWLTFARELVGLTEIVGSANEPKVVKFFADAGVPEIAEDSVAWCGAFVAAMFVKAGRRDVRPPGDRYNALRAREWLKVGQEVREPLPGDLVIFTREGGGHVAFYVGETATQIKVLGGNQSNSVSVQNYPKSRLLGFRRVTGVKQPEKPVSATKPPVPSSPPLRPSPEPEIGDAEFNRRDPEDALRGDDAPTFWERLLALFGIGKKWPGR
jgi:uncharacterized protein (TIGR02594 family)